MPFHYHTKTSVDNVQEASTNLMLERKQKSMAIGMTHAHEEINPSSLLQKKPKGERGTLRGYDSLNEAARG